MYAAIIGDIIGSKKIKERDESQKKLKQVLETLNQEYKTTISSSLTLTLGDEFQGLFSSPAFILEIIDKIKFNMYPVELRFGIGFGEILTEIDREISIGSDGPAYWHARAAINNVHEENDYHYSRLLIKKGNESSQEKVINDSLKLCDFIESRWRETQRELVEVSVIKFGHYQLVSQTELAGMLGVSKQATNQRIQSSGYYQYLRMKNSITQLLIAEWEE